MQADAELQLPLGGQVGVQGGDQALDLDGALQRLHGAAELGQEVVAREVVEATPVLANVKLDLFAPCRHRPDGGVLVLGHEARVANHVGRQDRGEVALRAGHGGIVRLR